jgi:small glutamine-rich tetratricopeptide repeat-containing protein alpha
VELFIYLFICGVLAKLALL